MFGLARATRGRFLLALLLVVVLSLCAVPFTGAAPDASLLVDDFSTAQTALTATIVGTPVSSSVSGAGILGGERDIQVTVTAEAVPGTSSTTQVINHYLSHSQQSGVYADTLVQWDGADGGSPTLSLTTLPPTDLTVGNTQNGLEIQVNGYDHPVYVWFYIYSDATHASQGRLSLTGTQTFNLTPTSYYLPFGLFATKTGYAGPANFASVRAVEMWINGYNEATDLTIDTVRTTAVDWGDLPDASVGGPDYATRGSANGPRHVIGNLYLGSLIDAHELNGLPTTAANGDNLNGLDDEDGVVRTPGWKWSPANGGSVDVMVTGGSGCLSGWIDWNKNGSFADAGDEVLTNRAVTTGTSTQKFPITANLPFSSPLYARFRLYAPDAGGCTSAKSPTGQAVNGEVEDYAWSFGPNAVSVQSFSGSASPAALPVVGMILASTATLVAGLWKVLKG